MTSLSTAITIAAPVERIYRLGSQTERWPQILPHYRYVRLLKQRGATRTVEMSALRDRIPITWVAEQRDDPDTPAIHFEHLRGWTRGMEVVWRFERVPDGTRVTIEHDLDFRFPVAAAWLGEHVVGGYFIDYVAGKTLACIKAIAEGRA